MCEVYVCLCGGVGCVSVFLQTWSMSISSDAQLHTDILPPARQYKEAARISSEMKTLSAILDSEREKVRQADSELATGNEQLSIMARDLGTIREDLERLEREEGSSSLIPSFFRLHEVTLFSIL